MNLTGLLNFKSVETDGDLEESDQVYLFAANSLKAVIDEFFLVSAPSFIIVLSCRRKSPLYFIHHVMQLLVNLMVNMNIQVVCIHAQSPILVKEPRLHNLLLVDSFEAFLDIDVRSYRRRYANNVYFHIFLMQRDRYVFQDMKSIFSYCWNNDIINCNVQYQNAFGEIFMYTYFPFTDNKCASIEPKLINTFIGDSWIDKTHFHRKLKNFNGCPLVAVVRDIPPYSHVTTAADGSVSFSGFEVDIFKYLAKRNNFTLDLRTRAVDDRAIPFDNGALKMVAERTADVAFGFYRRCPSGDDKYSTTFPHYQTQIVAIIYLPAHLLNTFEVLLFPFENFVWWTLAFSVVIILVIIRLLRKTDTQSMSAFFVVACALGSPIQLRPKMPHSVLVFMTWLWCTFLIRTFYSQLLFHLLRNRVYSLIPQTLNQAVDENFAAVMNQFMYSDIRKIPIFENSQNRTSIVLSSDNELSPLHYIEESNDKRLYAITSFDFLSHFVDKYQKRGQFYVLTETIVRQQMCFYMAKHSILINQFDYEIMFIRSSGLFKRWAQRYINNNYFEKDYLYQDAFFIQEDLWSIYLVCLSVYIFAFMIFLIELLSLKVKFLVKFFK